MGKLNIVAEHRGNEAYRELERALYAHNRSVTEHTSRQPVLFYLRDGSDALRGGIAGYHWGGVVAHHDVVGAREPARTGLRSSVA